MSRQSSSSAVRDRYAGVKHGLALREWRHVQHDADAKSAIIEEIISGDLDKTDR